IENSDAGGMGSVTRESACVSYVCDAIADARGEKSFAADKLRIDRNALAQREAARFGFVLQPRDLGPGGFRIDEIPGDGRNATPIVDAGFEQTREIVVA